MYVDLCCSLPACTYLLFALYHREAIPALKLAQLENVAGRPFHLLLAYSRRPLSISHVLCVTLGNISNPWPPFTLRIKAFTRIKTTLQGLTAIHVASYLLLARARLNDAGPSRPISRHLMLWITDCTSFLVLCILCKTHVVSDVLICTYARHDTRKGRKY